MNASLSVTFDVVGQQACLFREDTEGSGPSSRVT